MVTAQLHRATDVHLSNQTPEAAKGQSKGLAKTMGANGPDQRNNSTEREPRDQRPHDD